MGRIAVPDLFTRGAHEQVLIMTFGLDIEFYERVLRRHFAGFSHQIVLADGTTLDGELAHVADSTTVRHLNRTWLAGPVGAPRAAHAKVILLAGPEVGTLLVGSGNSNLDGYARAGECFTAYRWSPEAPDDLVNFVAVREVTDRLAAAGHLDRVTTYRLEAFWDRQTWWNATPAGAPAVRHNLERPLGDQLVEAVGEAATEELTVAAPFFDKKCQALTELVDQLSPQRLRVLLQPERASVDPRKLAAVLGAVGGEVYAMRPGAEAPEGTYLHAKIVVAKTDAGDVCLTGSANCSMAALWEPPGPRANIEIANLAAGASGAFDALFAPAFTVIEGPVAPLSLGVAFRSDPKPPQPALRVWDLMWKAPALTGVIGAEVQDASKLTILIDGAEARPSFTIELPTYGATTFRALFTNEDEIKAIEEVSVVRVVLDGDESRPAVPYQIAHLDEQGSHRKDPEQMRRAAIIEYGDPQIEAALAVLEEILVGSRVTSWSRMPRPAPADEPGDTATSLAWEEIDWSAVRRDQRYRAYGGAGALQATKGSDLAIYLQALSRAVRELLGELDVVADVGLGAATPIPTTAPADEDEEETAEADLAQGLEGSDLIELDEDDPEDAPVVRSRSAAGRNLVLVRNFVRRNIEALENEIFRREMGAPVVVLNTVTLNWLCWWVATLDEDRPGELVEERLRLWRILWGDVAQPGYLAELTDELQDAALTFFDENRVEAVTMASMVDVWDWTDWGDPRRAELRDIERSALVNPCWQVTAEHLRQAAALASGRPVSQRPYDAASLAESFAEAAAQVASHNELRQVLAGALDLAPGDLELEHRGGVRSGFDDEQNVQWLVSEADISAGISRTQAELLLRSWLARTDEPRLRAKWLGGVAYYDTGRSRGWMYDEATDKMTELGPLATIEPKWLAELNGLLAAADRLVESDQKVAEAS